MKEIVGEEIEKIKNMSHEELARLFRFAPSGHEYFDHSLPYAKFFFERFESFGGMTSAISKKIGWENGKN